MCLFHNSQILTLNAGTPDWEEVYIGPHTYQVRKIGTSLCMEEERELIDKLIKNGDMFAWDPSNIAGIDTKVGIHHITIHLPLSQGHKGNEN